MQGDNILSAQVSHFRRARQKPLSGASAGPSSSATPQSQSSVEQSPTLSPTSSSSVSPPSSRHLSPSSPSTSSALTPSHLSLSPTAGPPRPSTSPTYHPSSRSLPSTPTTGGTEGAENSHATPPPPPPALSASVAQTLQETARQPSVGRISPRVDDGGSPSKEGLGPVEHHRSASLPYSPLRTPMAINANTPSLPPLSIGSPSPSPSPLSTHAVPGSGGPVPPLNRSQSVRSAATSPSPVGGSGSDSFPSARNIPLRTMSPGGAALLSPLATPSPVNSQLRPTAVPGTPRSSTFASTMPSVRTSSPTMPSSMDGLTPQTTIRTLSTFLPSDSTTPSSDPSAASVLTPSSAMRVLFTGQSAISGVQPAPTSRRLSGRYSRDTSPQVSPLSPTAVPSPSSRVPPALQLTSPLTRPHREESAGATVPKLNRAATMDELGALDQHGLSKGFAASSSDLLSVPEPTSPSQLLQGEESDSDDDDQSPRARAVDAATIPVPTSHGVFFHRLLSRVPFSLPRSFVHHVETAYAVLLTLSLFYALFVDPIRLALLPAWMDAYLAVVMLCIFALLLLEFVFFIVSNPSYCHSLEALLDFMATLSLLPQVYVMFTEAELTRMQRSVMMMMRAGVLVRLVGVLRLIPVQGLLHHNAIKGMKRWWSGWSRRHRRSRWQQGDEQDDSKINLIRADDDDSHGSGDEAASSDAPGEVADVAADGLSSVLYPSHASRIGQLLSDYTAHRVVLGVLFTLILYNYFHPHVVHTIHPYAIHHLDALMEGAMNTSTSILEHTVQDYQQKYRDEILHLSMDGVTLHTQPELIAQLRPHEKERIVTPHFDVLVSVKKVSQHFALFDFWSLLLVLLLLPVLLRLIYDDVHAVVSPIERMCRFVTNLATDPMSEIASADATSLSSSLSSLLPPSSSSSLSSAMSSSVPSASLSSSFSLDSFFVELTLQKLAVLLQLVFGSAGAAIIANNIRGDYLEVVTPGRKVYAIFAFMGVEGWDDMMEVLQVEMSELMNVTAELVHSVCVLFGGEVNKNIGNAFLLVWKLEAEAHRGHTDGGKEGEARRPLLPSHAEKTRRKSHHADERTHHQVHPSTSVPHSLANALHQRPASRTPDTSPRVPSPAITVRSQSVMAPEGSQLRRRRGGLRRREDGEADGDAGREADVDDDEEAKESHSPSEDDSPIAPVHLDTNIPHVREALSAEGKRRNSLVQSIAKLHSRDLGSIFSRSSVALLTGKSADEALESPQRRPVNSRQSTGVLEDDSEHLLPPPASMLHQSSAVDESLSAGKDSFYSRTHPTPPMAPGRRPHGWKVNAGNHRVAEHALSSFLLTLLQLSTSPSLLKWRTHPLLAAHHLSLQFGIGLHVGWAIEGAIGSSHKIDASYLSPNVNLSSRLSMLCHHYHLPLLFSSSFYSLLGPDVQKRCRKVDVVSVKGSRRPIGIYTFDIDFGDVEDMERGRREQREREAKAEAATSAGSKDKSGADTNRAAAVEHHATFDERMRRKQVREIEDIMRQLKKAVRRTRVHGDGEHDKEAAGSSTDDDDDEERAQPLSAGGGRRRSSAPDLSVGTGMHRSSSSSALHSHSPLLPSLPALLSSLQSRLPAAFIPLYNAACSCYIDGDWRSAGRLLVRVLNMRSGDGPSQLLLKVMAKEGFRAPTGWKGYRVLTKK